MTKKARIILLTAVLAAVCLFTSSAWAEKVITMTFTGDVTLGSEEAKRSAPESFDSFAKSKGYDYFFANFRDLFSADDCTVINLEGVLSDSPNGENTGKTYRFRGPTDFVKILTGASVEVAGIANNHILDYQNIGMNRTTATLEEAGIRWCRGVNYTIFEKDGIRIAVFGMDYSLANTAGDRVRKIMKELKDTGEANAIVVLFHNGNEYDARHTELQRTKGVQYTKDGADLVIMHHPHVVQGFNIENNRSVFYSLGNFVFGGNKEIRVEDYRGNRQTTSQYTLVVQARFYFRDDGTYAGQQMILYPGYTTGAAPKNNYQPRRVTVEEAEPILDAIRYDSLSEVPDLGEDEEGYARIVMPFLAAGSGAQGGSGDGAPEDPAGYPDRGQR